MWKKVVGVLILIAICSIPALLSAQISSNSESAKDIRKVVGENTPEFIARPIVNLVVALENFQVNGGIAAEMLRLRVENELKVEKTNIFSKTIKYAELGSYIVWSDVLNNEFIYFFLIIVLTLIIIGYIARLFFL